MVLQGYKIDGFFGRSLLTESERQFVLDQIPINGNVLEIGTLSGTTVAWWAFTRPEATFVSVDIFQKGPSPGAGDPTNWFKNKQPNMRLWLGTTPQLSLICKDTQFDIIFVDGRHSTEGCLRDLVAARRITKINGRVLCHDYDPGNTQFGVADAVDQCDIYKIDKVVGKIAVLSHNEFLPKRPRTP